MPMSTIQSIMKIDNTFKQTSKSLDILKKKGI